MVISNAIKTCTEAANMNSYESKSFVLTFPSGTFGIHELYISRGSRLGKKTGAFHAGLERSKGKITNYIRIPLRVSELKPVQVRRVLKKKKLSN